ncbi:MAG: polysaccharide biosynthesis/export family protein [Sandarakinorhabdus sp.]|nr:polysaccharide biosynthesis/export family protein [Sandarakinorhabdus sp.]
MTGHVALQGMKGWPGPMALFGALLLAVLWAQPSMAQAQQAQAQQAQARGAGASAAYLLGPSDAITVLVFGQSEFNVQTRVKPDGSITMPLIGRVVAEGKSVITLADEIARRLTAGNFLRDPIVNVEVNEFNSRFVRVAGKVGAPGLVPLDRSTRLLDVLLRAGWIQPGASEFVTIRRAADGKEVSVNSRELARGAVADIHLAPGDTVFIDDAELVYLTGAVARPGAYPLKVDMTVTELLATAGGVSATGSANRVGLKRDGARERDVDARFELEAGDIINVRERLF